MKVLKSISIVGGLLCSTLTMAAESNLVISSGGVPVFLDDNGDPKGAGEVTGEAVITGAEGGDAAFGVSMSVTVGQPFITVLKSDGSSTPHIENNCSMDLGPSLLRTVINGCPTVTLMLTPNAASPPSAPVITASPVTSPAPFGSPLSSRKTGTPPLEITRFDSAAIVRVEQSSPPTIDIDFKTFMSDSFVF
jgi:hypothetical protein